MSGGTVGAYIVGGAIAAASAAASVYSSNKQAKAQEAASMRAEQQAKEQAAQQRQQQRRRSLPQPPHYRIFLHRAVLLRTTNMAVSREGHSKHELVKTSAFSFPAQTSRTIAAFLRVPLVRPFQFVDFLPNCPL